MVARPVADRLLGLLHEYLADLRGLKGLTYTQYASDVRTRRFAERTLHIAIEACLDLGHHIIADEGFREPQDNKDVFRVLAEEGILPEDLAADLLKMASFRNLIVHAYGTIDDAVVLGLVQRRLGDLEQFAAAILRYLDR
ncbi:MAG: DUF86 domain-containing protein [Deltaproteobacteria bacterium]|nr:DUF86 domain-containing protein [Deltaproteobacteria bacterium]